MQPLWSFPTTGFDSRHSQSESLPGDRQNPSRQGGEAWGCRRSGVTVPPAASSCTPVISPMRWLPLSPTVGMSALPDSAMLAGAGRLQHQRSTGWRQRVAYRLTGRVWPLISRGRWAWRKTGQYDATNGGRLATLDRDPLAGIVQNLRDYFLRNRRRDESSSIRCHSDLGRRSRAARRCSERFVPACSTRAEAGGWRFEERFAECIGSKHCVMVNSGSSANLLMGGGPFYTQSKHQLNRGDEVSVQRQLLEHRVASCLPIRSRIKSGCRPL